MFDHGTNRSPILETEQRWKTDARWKGIVRPYSAADVFSLRGSVHTDHGFSSIAKTGAERLWNLLLSEDYLPTFNAMDSIQAVKHQKSVGAGYFDKISGLVTGGDSSTLALTGSTEEEHSKPQCRLPKELSQSLESSRDLRLYLVLA